MDRIDSRIIGMHDLTCTSVVVLGIGVHDLCERTGKTDFIRCAMQGSVGHKGELVRNILVEIFIGDVGEGIPAGTGKGQYSRHVHRLGVQVLLILYREHGFGAIETFDSDDVLHLIHTKHLGQLGRYM